MDGSKNNLLWRVATGFVLITVVVLACFTHRLAIFALVEVMIALATREFVKLASLRGVNLNYYLVVGLCLMFPVAAYLAIPPVYLLLGSFLIIALAGILKKNNSPLGFFGLSVFTIVYLGLLPTHLLLLKQLVIRHHFSPAPLLFPLVATWINDTAAYGFGAWLGRHKMFPVLSPKKSWEGTVAGFVFSVGFSLLFWRIWMQTRPFWYFIVLGAVISLLALFGDLFESSFKREAGVKDSSRSLPGHGGFLDRIDSLLFTVPGFYYFLLILGL